MPPKIYIRHKGPEGGTSEIPIASLRDETSGLYPTEGEELVGAKFDFSCKPQKVTVDLRMAPTLAGMLRGKEDIRPIRTAQFTHKGVAELKLKKEDALVVDLERVLNPNRKYPPVRRVIEPAAYTKTCEQSHIPGIFDIHRIIPESEFATRTNIGFYLSEKGIQAFPYTVRDQLDFVGKPIEKGSTRIYTPLPQDEEIIDAYEALVAKVLLFESYADALPWSADDRLTRIGNYIEGQVEENYRGLLPSIESIIDQL